MGLSAKTVVAPKSATTDTKAPKKNERDFNIVPLTSLSLPFSLGIELKGVQFLYFLAAANDFNAAVYVAGL